MTLKNALNDNQQQIDQQFMKMALQLARKSEKIGEVPIGAVLIDASGQVLARSTNLREKATSILGHAELVVLHRASQVRKSWRLNGCTLYVSLEPCLMCAAALVQARVARVVYATPDPKGGGLGSLADYSNDPRLNHHFVLSSGLYQEQASQMLKKFFKAKRVKPKI